MLWVVHHVSHPSWQEKITRHFLAECPDLTGDWCQWDETASWENKLSLVTSVKNYAKWKDWNKMNDCARDYYALFFIY